MTLAQLQSFVLVARLGSVKAAAAELEVTEPAVSVAVAALRKELGDELFVREGRGIALTAGGRRLAALAGEILGLAEQARRSVHDSAGQPRRLQVVATNVVAEHIGPLIEAFTARDEGLEISIEAVPGASFADRLEHRQADIALGPHPGPERANTIATVPFLRCRLIIVAAPGHPLSGRPDVAARRARHRALAGGPARHRSDDRDRPVLRSQRLGPDGYLRLRESRRRDRGRRRGRGHPAHARALGDRGGPPAGADADRRSRHPDRGDVAREHARPRARRAGGARAAALRDDLGRDAGDLDRAAPAPSRRGSGRRYT